MHSWGWIHQVLCNDAYFGRCWGKYCKYAIRKITITHVKTIIGFFCQKTLQNHIFYYWSTLFWIWRTFLTKKQIQSFSPPCCSSVPHSENVGQSNFQKRCIFFATLNRHFFTKCVFIAIFKDLKVKLSLPSLIFCTKTHKSSIPKLTNTNKANMTNR